MKRIISWNVNGIRAILKKGFISWLMKENPDILCLQETKADPEQLSNDLLRPYGYYSYWNTAEKKGYSGVCIYSKQEPVSVKKGLGIKEFDIEGRQLELDFKKFVLINTYFPNGGKGNIRVPYKMRYYEAFLKRIKKLSKQRREIIFCGDINTAHKEMDLARPKQNEKNTGFLPEERAWISQVVSKGFIDTFRHFCSDPCHYTWWDYKTSARKRNVGWRLDYFFISSNLLPNLRNAIILKDVMGSDHCPIAITLDKI